MSIKLFDSELKVMEVLWRDGVQPARRIADALETETGWNVNTSYTVIKKCVTKGAVERKDPGFLCRALVTKEEVQGAETDALIDKIFDGSADLLFASLIGRKKLTAEQVKDLLRIVEEES